MRTVSLFMSSVPVTLIAIEIKAPFQQDRSHDQKQELVGFFSELFHVGLNVIDLDIEFGDVLMAC